MHVISKCPKVPLKAKVPLLWGTLLRMWSWIAGSLATVAMRNSVMCQLPGWKTLSVGWSMNTKTKQPSFRGRTHSSETGLNCSPMRYQWAMLPYYWEMWSWRMRVCIAALSMHQKSQGLPALTLEWLVSTFFYNLFQSKLMFKTRECSSALYFRYASRWRQMTVFMSKSVKHSLKWFIQTPDSFRNYTNDCLHLKWHTSLLYSEWKTACEQSSMSKFTIFIKQKTKSPWMTHYFWLDSASVHPGDSFYHMRPWENICELQWSDWSW